MPSDATVLIGTGIGAAAGIAGSWVKATVETRRLREERHDERREERRSRYQAFLNTETELATMRFATRHREFEPVREDETLDVLTARTNAVAIVGTADVVNAMQALANAYRDNADRTKIAELRGELLDAMRRDVGAG